jgi:hypothetical protein
VESAIPKGPMLAGFEDTDSIFGRWIDLKLNAIREVAGDTSRPVFIKIMCSLFEFLFVGV